MSKYDHLIGTELVAGEWSWTADRAMLYAVGVGAGLPDPLEDRQFTTENTPGIQHQVLPTFLALMNLPSNWLSLLGWDGKGPNTIGVVHGEQSVTLARSLPSNGKAHIRTVLRGVYDKTSGALLDMETEIKMAETGELLGRTQRKLFAQGKGGFGGPRRPADEQPWERPGRQPDREVSLPVGVNQSLIYRLSGDHHPHGTDPATARRDGFERPIYYGMGTFGVAGRAVLKALCDSDVSRFGHLEGRFSKPVHPGDTLDTLIWRTDEGALFQTLANRERVVLDRGIFRFR